jgi:hypothetical protein
MIKYPEMSPLYDALIYQLKIIFRAPNVEPDTAALVMTQEGPRNFSRIPPMIYSCHLCLGRCHTFRIP